MEFLVNDLSIEGQFPDITTFRSAINRIMEIRRIASHYGRTLHCHREIAQTQVTSGMTMLQAVQRLSVEERRSLMFWLTQQGPFWEDARIHNSNEWLECKNQIVTDTAVGEAARCCFNGICRNLVSVVPSSWLFTPVSVDWVTDSDRESVDIQNFWNPDTVEVFLRIAPSPLKSWEQLESLAASRWSNLTFASDTFKPLLGYPFVPGAAQRIYFILDTLNRFKNCFNDDGQLTPEGHELYRNFFTGKKGEGGRGALFSDSSHEEKHLFRTKMTFKNPQDPGESIFCPWHGKIQTPQLRVHFSWPVRADKPLYVVYAGEKITKR